MILRYLKEYARNFYHQLIGFQNLLNPIPQKKFFLFQVPFKPTIRSQFVDSFKIMSASCEGHASQGVQSKTLNTDSARPKKENEQAEQDQSSTKKKHHKRKNKKPTKDGNETRNSGHDNRQFQSNKHEKHISRVTHSSKSDFHTKSSSIPDHLLSAHHGKNKSEAGAPSYDYEEDEVEPEQKSKPKSHHRHHKLPEMQFEAYISFEECSDGLKRGELLQGVLRINIRNFHEAFITSESGGRDIHIEGVQLRNRALSGDIVVIQILPEDQWRRISKPGSSDDVELVRTAKVVFILEKKNPRIAVGHLNSFRNNAFGFALLSPIDNRLPRLMIPLTDCPKEFKARPKDFEKMLFVSRIANWNLNMAFASGKLMKSIGEAGHIEPETEALLISNDIDSLPFSSDVLKCLPGGDTWCISADELAKRKDLRHECILTIDPDTAKDLDDALSCKKIDDDLYEVGVHIADVSHFIDQGNALDQVAMQRGTSVYLAQRVIPMLPAVLCEKLCSLNPGVERLAYSVIWNLRSDGTVLKEWFGRTVIRSCAKFSYNHAQQMIDSDDGEAIISEQFPEVFGNFTLEKIRETIKTLFGISSHLRHRRFDMGALRLDQPKLSFSLDDKSGLPNGFGVYQYKDSNRMIEEFMLLANMAVGRKIYRDHPDRAILRSHPPPHPVMMQDVAMLCAQYGIAFDITDSASISRSLGAISELDEDVQNLLGPALTLLSTKPFQNAVYFCTGSVENELNYRHYALNVPIYTHFTSPIRRYPDVLVHRFLTAALDPTFEVNGDVKELQAIAGHCNDKKWSAKKASEQSSMLFFAVYLMTCGPVHERGVVVGVLDKAVDVLCTRLGLVNRVYCDRLSLYKHDYQMIGLKPELTIYWEDDTNKTVDEKITSLTKKFERGWQKQKNNDCGTTAEEVPIPEDAVKQKLCMFSPVDVILSVDSSAPTKVVAILKSPFSSEAPDLKL